MSRAMNIMQQAAAEAGAAPSRAPLTVLPGDPKFGETRKVKLIGATLGPDRKTGAPLLRLFPSASLPLPGHSVSDHINVSGAGEMAGLFNEVVEQLKANGGTPRNGESEEDYVTRAAHGLEIEVTLRRDKDGNGSSWLPGRGYETDAGMVRSVFGLKFN